mgnify:CR=1 FL=1
MPFCSNCGAQISPNAAFCPKCGSAATSGASRGASPGSSGYSAAGGYANEPVRDADTPLPENVAGMLAYFTIIPAILFLVLDPYNRNRFIRFHSFQCLFTFVAIVAVQVVLTILFGVLHFIPVIGTLVGLALWPLFGLASFALWVLLVVKAYQHEIFKLPYIGDLAEKQAS